MNNDNLNIREVKGIGPKTEKTLNEAGYFTVEDICKDMDFFEKAQALEIKNIDEIMAHANFLFMEKYTTAPKKVEQIPGMKNLLRPKKINHNGTTYLITQADEVDELVNVQRYEHGKRSPLDLANKLDKALSHELYLQYVK